MKENFIEFILKNVTLDILISIIVYKFLTSLVEDVVFPCILGTKESLDLKKFTDQLIFTSITFVVIYIISISI